MLKNKKAKRIDKKKQQRRINNDMSIFFKTHNKELLECKNNIRRLSSVIFNTLTYIDTCSRFDPSFKPDEMLKLRNETMLLHTKYVVLINTFNSIPSKLKSMEHVFAFTTTNVSFIELAAATEQLRQSANVLFTEYDELHRVESDTTTEQDTRSCYTSQPMYFQTQEPM